jgi:bacterioferritin (cytochrome b1)
VNCLDEKSVVSFAKVALSSITSFEILWWAFSNLRIHFPLMLENIGLFSRRRWFSLCIYCKIVTFWVKGGSFMSIKSNLPEWWRRWFGSSAKGNYKVLSILRSRYTDERQRAARLTQHAQKMQDPLFREALLRIAADKSRHGDWIAEKINEIGGSLPPELTISSTERNSWQYLLDDLEAERQCSAELEKAMLTIASDYPEIVVILQRIDKEKHKHRDEIRKMLMRIPRPCGQPPSVRRILYGQ